MFCAGITSDLKISPKALCQEGCPESRDNAEDSLLADGAVDLSRNSNLDLPAAVVTVARLSQCVCDSRNALGGMVSREAN